MNALTVQYYLETGNAIGLQQYTLVENDTINRGLGVDMLDGVAGK